MSEQVIPKHRTKNLICVLPGKDTEQIVVVARYDRRSGTDDPAQGWTDAAMLPILYNALLAGHRQHTFVFVALCGTAGENAFLASLHSNHPPPKVMVVMDSLGRSSPSYYTLEGSPLSAKGRERAAMKSRLESEAAFTARLEGLPVSLTATPAATQNSLLFDTDATLPSILVYSTFKWKGPGASEAFRQDFEFLAYYLCRIDLKLANPASSSH